MPEELVVDLDLGAGLLLRELTVDDAGLVVEATRAETEPALWGPRPSGPYSHQDAVAALAPRPPRQERSFGLIQDDRLLGGLMLLADGEPGSAELAYWVRPERRREGLALRGILGLTDWAHRQGGLGRLWVEINPVNAASIQLAERAGYTFEKRIADHCREWVSDSSTLDSWHDCLIFAHHQLPGR